MDNLETLFPRIKRLPPYVFAVVDQIKMEARHKGEDIIDLGMGNPDLATPKHIINKLIEAAQKQRNHRYSASRGITKLREAIANWYKRRYEVDIDPEREAVVTIGSKEGISHLMLVMLSSGDLALVPSPTYPIHSYAIVIANADVRSIPLTKEHDFFEELKRAIKDSWPRPKLLILSFPHNPTTEVVDRDFFEKIVALAKEDKIWVIHDLAYADLTFDNYKAPSFLQTKGAKEIGVEFFTMSKSYNMPGWRVGFCVGNEKVISALTRIKSYLDYGIFQPIQIASIIALRGPQECVQETVRIYKQRRDSLVEGLNRIGWEVEKPMATMFVWAKIPQAFRHLGSVEFSLKLIREAKVAISPGIGFGEYGDEYVRFALVENPQRIRQAIRGIRKVIEKG
jgi:alanine-synthesizing transaminase